MGGRNGFELREESSGVSGALAGAACWAATTRSEVSLESIAAGTPSHWQSSLPQHLGLFLSGAGWWPPACVPETRGIECVR